MSNIKNQHSDFFFDLTHHGVRVCNEMSVYSGCVQGENMRSKLSVQSVRPTGNSRMHVLFDPVSPPSG